ncbi:MAG TPA: hypothetical protein VGX92_07210 [Pyrinomonadaceae bacterium]|nr:hypothetical protein [Pyrinomonadaceae bacterium]
MIIAVAALVMLAALLSAPRIRKYAREKNRAAAPPPAATQSSSSNSSSDGNSNDGQRP